MGSVIRWGILGTGRIAHEFTAALRLLPDAEVVAIGSRTADKAAAVGEALGIPRRHGSYEALAADAEVDIVYVATPHALHRDNTLLCLAAGKAVLCEKPLALNHVEATQMVRAARSKGLFLMEGMWTRFFPALRAARERIAAGDIGEPRMLHCDFGVRNDARLGGRLFDPALGGGALLDVGVYPVALSSMLFGSPVRIAGVAHLAAGIDEQCGMVLLHARGELSVLSAAARTITGNEALIAGTAGRIRLHESFWQPRDVTLSRPGRPDERLSFPASGGGLEYEAADVMRCLRAGKIENELMPLDESLSTMRTLDELRAHFGLVYPTETARDG